MRIRHKERAALPPAVIDLGDVSAGPKRFDRMVNPAPIKRAGIYLGCVVVAALVVLRLDLLSPLWTAVVFSLPAISALRLVIYFWIPFSTEQYRTKTGALAFDIIREKKTADELDEFMKAIDAAIRTAEQRPTPTS